MGRWFSDGRSAAAVARRRRRTTAPGASSLATAKRGLPCTIRDGESTGLKRRTRGTHLGAWNRGRGTGKGDRGGAADCGGELQGGGTAGRGKGEEVVREEQGLGGPFIGGEGKGRGRGEAVGRVPMVAGAING
jgi:hypothetical protein